MNSTILLAPVVVVTIVIVPRVVLDYVVIVLFILVIAVVLLVVFKVVRSGLVVSTASTRVALVSVPVQLARSNSTEAKVLSALAHSAVLPRGC